MEQFNKSSNKAMLEQAAHLHDEIRKLKQEDSGKDNLTFLQRPYARSNPQKAAKSAPVWFTAYMPSIVGPEEDGREMSPLETLCDLNLWKHFAALGIKAVHTGPVMKAGGMYLDGHTYASIDGWFDPIALAIDPVLGSERDYARLTWIAENMPEDSGKSLRGCVIGDIVPGHTGMGPDFQLALQGFSHYPGLYVLARVDGLFDGSDLRARKLTPKELHKLSRTSPNDVTNEFTRLLDDDEVAALVRAKVIPGRPQRRLGTQAGCGWSITDEVSGVADESGKTVRRWVYLHFFHPKQPTLNFLDPSYGAFRLVTGQLNYVMWQLRSTGVRLDANAFLGIEPWSSSNKSDLGPASEVRETWSESHPLSYTVTNMLAWQARRLGGFSFQEMNMSVGDIAQSFQFGPDLAYDFITRPGCEHAILTEDCSLLTFMYEEMGRFKINPGSLVHALQNHDEITYELVHLRQLESSGHTDQTSIAPVNADEIVIQMRRIGLGRTKDDDISIRTRRVTDFYNQESGNGLCTTIAGLIAARLKCRTLDEAWGRTSDIQKGHLLLAAFNAFQPGVFALSGWDLVGALPIELEKIPSELLNGGPVPKEDPLEKDYRWINRGAFRLMSHFGKDEWNGEKRYGCLKLPQARALYGPLDEQAKRPGSFFRQLQNILAIRKLLDIGTSEFVGLVSGLPEGVLGFELRLRSPQDEERAKGAGLIILNFRAPGSTEVSFALSEIVKSLRWGTLSAGSWQLRDASVDHAAGCLTLDDDPMGARVEDLQELDPWDWKAFYMRLG